MYSYTTIASKVWIEGMLLKIGISEANIWHLGRRAARPQLSESAATTKASETFPFKSICGSTWPTLQEPIQTRPETQIFFIPPRWDQNPSIYLVLPKSW